MKILSNKERELVIIEEYISKLNLEIEKGLSLDNPNREIVQRLVNTKLNLQKIKTVMKERIKKIE